MNKKICICAGRTGGPLLPLIALHTQLGIDRNAIDIVGIKHGFEESYAYSKGYRFIPFPEAKMSLMSFKSRLSPLRLIVLLLQNVGYAYNFCIACFLSVRYIMVEKPDMIWNAGSFTGVPLIVMARLVSLFRIHRVCIYIHQQDPIVGLANKITIPFADIITYVYDRSKKNIVHKPSQWCHKVKNFINVDTFDSPQCEYTPFRTLIENTKKPILFIYGGGSGSYIINEWVYQHIEQLISSYAVIHLIGSLQTQKDVERWARMSYPEYVQKRATHTDIPYILAHATWVISRAGLGSISELEYVNKNTILVPLADSHQEVNAQESSHFAHVVSEKELNTILDILSQNSQVQDTLSMHVMKQKYLHAQQPFFDYIKNIL